MTQWVVYHRPAAHPEIEIAVVRWYIIRGQDEPVRGDKFFGWHDPGALEKARDWIWNESQGCAVMVTRSPNDDPAIVEVWF